VHTYGIYGFPIGAHFCVPGTQKPGFPGLRFAPAPACGCGALRAPSNPLRGLRVGLMCKNCGYFGGIAGFFAGTGGGMRQFLYLYKFLHLILYYTKN
jgi:hypothetical protein